MIIDKKELKSIIEQNKLFIKFNEVYYISKKGMVFYNTLLSLFCGKHYGALLKSPLLTIMEENDIDVIEVDGKYIKETIDNKDVINSITDISYYNDGIYLNNQYKIAGIMSKESMEYNRLEFLYNIEMNFIKFFEPDMDDKKYIRINDEFVLEYTKALTPGVSLKQSKLSIYEPKDISKMNYLFGIELNEEYVKPWIVCHNKNNINMFHIYVIIRQKH